MNSTPTDHRMQNHKSSGYRPYKALTMNFVFLMHSPVTSALLILASLYITCQSLRDGTMDCNFPFSSPDKKHVSDVCLDRTTYSFEGDLKNGTAGLDTIYPGLSSKFYGQTKVFHSYYRWVRIVLLLQGLFFLITSFIWQGQIGDQISNLVAGINQPISPKNDTSKVIRHVAKQLYKNRGSNGKLLKTHILVEVLNFLNVILQFTFTNWFLDGKFTWYGWDVYSHLKTGTGSDLATEVFPFLSKCDFSEFDPSEGFGPKETICSLHLNPIHRWVYFVMWFWFSGLMVLSVLGLAYRALTLVFPMLQFAFSGNKKDIAIALADFDLADWFLVSKVSRNIDNPDFYELIEAIKRVAVVKKVKYSGGEKLTFVCQIEENSGDESN